MSFPFFLSLSLFPFSLPSNSRSSTNGAIFFLAERDRLGCLSYFSAVLFFQCSWIVTWTKLINFLPLHAKQWSIHSSVSSSFRFHTGIMIMTKKERKNNNSNVRKSSLNQSRLRRRKAEATKYHQEWEERRKNTFLWNFCAKQKKKKKSFRSFNSHLAAHSRVYVVN